MTTAKTVVEYFIQWKHAQGHWCEIDAGSLMNSWVRTWLTRAGARKWIRKQPVGFSTYRGRKLRMRYRIVKQTTTTEVVENVR